MILEYFVGNSLLGQQRTLGFPGFVYPTGAGTSETHSIAATVASTSTVSANLIMTFTVTATVAGVSSVTASMKLFLRATVTAVSTVGSDLSRTLGVAATTAGVSVIQGILAGSEIIRNSKSFVTFFHRRRIRR